MSTTIRKKKTSFGDVEEGNKQVGLSGKKKKEDKAAKDAAILEKALDGAIAESEAANVIDGAIVDVENAVVMEEVAQAVKENPEMEVHWLFEMTDAEMDQNAISMRQREDMRLSRALICEQYKKYVAGGCDIKDAKLFIDILCKYHEGERKAWNFRDNSVSDVEVEFDED